MPTRKLTMNHRALAAISLLALTVWLGSAPAGAAPPHDSSNGIVCLECHALGMGTHGVTLPRGAVQESGCKSCHNPTGRAASMSQVAMHVVRGGAVTVDCGSCHFVHFPHTTTDSHPGGVTAPNLSLVRGDTSRYVAGALEPALFQVRPDQFAFAADNPPYNGICQSCHTQTTHHRNDASGDHTHNAGSNCLSCHPHTSGFGGLDHERAGLVVPVIDCMECHGAAGPDTVDDVHGGECGLCHVDPAGAGPLVEPWETNAPSGGDCIACHGTFSAAHPAVDHTATPGSGAVVIFADDDHDDAGWNGERPYFDVAVDCGLCHSTALTAVHGGRCSTCHPTPLDSLVDWNGSCQQGGCHATFHADVFPAHWPFSDPYDAGNDCDRCHQPGVGPVVQNNCLNCHAPVWAVDHTPPVTSSDALASYTGPARIRFSVRDGGKVAAGTTFHRLDGGEVGVGSKVLVSAPGSHSLAFWSKDQAGNVETPARQAAFSVIEDTTPPTTTSNAQALYYQGGFITLTATDASTLGVKATYYTLDDGPVRAGKRVSLPAVSGTFGYTLRFWSEDWSGNVEAAHTASFTVTSGTGTLRLVWGDSDVTGPPPEPDAWADWYIRRGSSGGYLVASGSGANPGWDGVDDVVVPVSPTPYFVDIWWWDTYYGWDDNTVFPNVLVSTPGQIVRLSY